jgi:hypothetical protein
VLVARTAGSAAQCWVVVAYCLCAGCSYSGVSRLHARKRKEYSGGLNKVDTACGRNYITRQRAACLEDVRMCRFLMIRDRLQTFRPREPSLESSSPPATFTQPRTSTATIAHSYTRQRKIRRRNSNQDDVQLLWSLERPFDQQPVLSSKEKRRWRFQR